MIAAMQGNLEITRLIHDSGCTTDINDVSLKFDYTDPTQHKHYVVYKTKTI